MSEEKHSAAYFGKQRDFWWNADFLELMAKRLEFKHVKSMLDVGCGIGHWGQLLSTVLPKHVHITGIEREKLWVNKAQERVKGASKKFEYLQGVAESLPFKDNTFDMVTCQTVLIHLADVEKVLREMLRVLKVGGLLLVAEPNNFASQAIFDTLSIRENVEVFIGSLEFYLRCEKGKQKLHLGYNSIGDMIPWYLHKLSLKDIKVYLSDKTSPLIPPYQTPEEIAVIEQIKEWYDQDFIIWNKAETEKYFVAGGGNPLEFERLWQKEKSHIKHMQVAIQNHTFCSAGGIVFYLISGRK